MFEKLAAPEAKQSNILQDFPERIGVIIPGATLVAFQHVADSLMHQNPFPSVSGSVPVC